MLKKQWKQPLFVVGYLMLAAGVMFAAGTILQIGYFEKTGWGWIITTLVSGMLILGFAFSNAYKYERKKQERIR
ncbi:hypothetical protein [Listeria costaricensis]|uniref:hypothetical protein n=1 Tax=Listeria costaricensis TaxID=2026604 RepID=UPI000C075127|nr:hypothetical protein [Listeria costaricensis]